MEENFDILRALMDVQGQDKVSNEYLLHILHLIDVPAAQKHDLDMLKRSYEMEIKLRSNQKQNEPQENARIARFEKRDCWIGTKPLTMEILKERLPALFEKPAEQASIEKTSCISKPRSIQPRSNVHVPPATITKEVTKSSVPLGDLFRKRAQLSKAEDDDENERPNGFHPQVKPNAFLTAGEKLQHDRILGKKNDEDNYSRPSKTNGSSAQKRPRPDTYHPINPHVLLGPGGFNRQQMDCDTEEYPYGNAVNKKFVNPLGQKKANQNDKKNTNDGFKNASAALEDDENIDPRLKSCDPELISKIEMEIVDYGDPITFEDIAGLHFAKKCVNELVIWPMARPDIFTGLRALPKGLLLFGPPGTGKTLIGKAIANQSGATFFSISASSLTSKWIGEGEKLVRTLFAVAAVKQPSVIFIDEIDSLLTQRSSEENEASRRMKTEFLVQLDGAGTKQKDIILVVGATNRPQELDEAARRRFVKRLYIPLPSFEARFDMVNRLLKDNKHDLTEENKQDIAKKTKGYSGADVRALCTEAAMGPIRSCADIRTMNANDVRPINLQDFEQALKGVRPSVSGKDLAFYREWNDEFGSFAFEGHQD